MAGYDLAVLGGGPGGYVAAIRAAQLGQKVCIIEKDKLGGICLNWGCIPTKALLKNAEVYKMVKKADLYGININGISVDFKKNVERSRTVSKQLSKGVEFLMKKNGVTHIVGLGNLDTENSLQVINGNKKKTIIAKNIIIATGAKPKTFPNVIIDGSRIIGSKEALNLKTIPKKIIIIGSGAIGSEFAFYFNTFGADVQMIEMQDRILPMEDIEISKALEESFVDSGIKVSTNSMVQKIEKLKTKIKVSIKKKSDTLIVDSDIVLLAIGVEGNINNIGLNRLGVRTKNGAVVIDSQCRTNIPNIYAIGDVSGPPWLAHKSSAQGHMVADFISGKNTHEIDYSNIPSCTYCQPQVGSLGLTESRALELGHNIKVGKFFFRASGKAMAVGNTTGFVKLIFDDQYGELLGAHIIGDGATEMIAELNIAKSLETTWEDIAMTIHAHPSLSEAVMEAALDAFGSAIHQ